MDAQKILDGLDFDYAPGCQFIYPTGVCGRVASSTAFVHANNSGTKCGDVFAYLCTDCLRFLVQTKLPGTQCTCCDRAGVGGFLRHARPIPVVAK